MALVQRLHQEMLKALKEGQRERVSVLRYALSVLKNREKDLGRELEDEEAYQVLRGLIKKGREAIEQFRQGKRDDLVQKEEKEIEVLESFLPKALSDEELEVMIEEAVKELGAQGPKDFGRVMKAVMTKVKGQAEGQRVSELVKKKLGSPLS